MSRLFCAIRKVISYLLEFKANEMQETANSMSTLYPVGSYGYKIGELYQRMSNMYHAMADDVRGQDNA